MFLDQVSAVKASHAQLLNSEAVDDDLQRALADTQAACHRAHSPTAKAFTKLLGVMRLMLHTEAVDTAASLLLDMRPLVEEALVVTASAQPVDSANAGGSETLPAPKHATNPSTDEEHKEGPEPVWINRLTECLLAVLADSVGGVPIAVVRSSAEGLWRTVTPHVNALALSDLLRVVTRMDRQDAEEDLFEEEGKGSEASGSEASASGSLEEGESEGEEDEGSAEGESNERVRRSDDGQRRNGREGEGSSSSSEESEADDEEMFRMDEQLSKYFSSIKASKQVRFRL